MIRGGEREGTGRQGHVTDHRKQARGSAEKVTVTEKMTDVKNSKLETAGIEPASVTWKFTVSE